VRQRAGAAAALVLLLVASGCRRDGTGGPPGEESAIAEGAAGSVLASSLLVFPNASGELARERRQLPLPQGVEERVAALLDALLAGPETAGLVAPFVEGVAVGSVYVDSHGVAYVDLLAPEQPDPPGSGSRLEMQRVYSVVDTVLLNVEGLRAVVLLWNGRQRQTFAGHLDTSRPLALDESLVTDAAGGD